MRKVVIYGLCDNLQEHLHLINMDEVICFVDEKADLCNTMFGKNVIRLDRVKDYQYDYFVVFNKAYILEFERKIIDAGIPEEKIINWVFYLFHICGNSRRLSRDAYQYLLNIVRDLSIDTICDIDFSLANQDFFYNEHDLLSNVEIDCYAKSKIDFREQYYSHVVESIEKKYDAIVYIDPFKKYTASDFYKLVEETREKSRYMIFTIPYSFPKEFTQWHEVNFNTWGEYKIVWLYWTQLVVIDKEYEYAVKEDDTAIYVVTHKEFTPPEKPIYIPIYAGKTNVNNMDIIGDGTGDNIAQYNPYINECTSLYWIWKNATQEYVGLNHYRRYFVKWKIDNDWQKNLLDTEYIKKALKNYDILVMPATDHFPKSQWEVIRESVNKKIFDEVWLIIRDRIIKKYPEYIDIFDYVFNGYVFYPCNMFVMRKELLDSYCTWLFNIILYACKRINLEKSDTNTKRVIGFIAERFLTIWIIYNKLNVKEVPVVMIDEEGNVNE